jgi:hypothetical protein
MYNIQSADVEKLNTDKLTAATRAHMTKRGKPRVSYVKQAIAKLKAAKDYGNAVSRGLDQKTPQARALIDETMNRQHIADVKHNDSLGYYGLSTYDAIEWRNKQIVTQTKEHERNARKRTHKPFNPLLRITPTGTCENPPPNLTPIVPDRPPCKQNANLKFTPIKPFFGALQAREKRLDNALKILAGITLSDTLLQECYSEIDWIAGHVSNIEKWVEKLVASITVDTLKKPDINANYKRKLSLPIVRVIVNSGVVEIANRQHTAKHIMNKSKIPTGKYQWGKPTIKLLAKYGMVAKGFKSQILKSTCGNYTAKIILE